MPCCEQARGVATSMDPLTGRTRAACLIWLTHAPALQLCGGVDHERDGADGAGEEPGGKLGGALL